MAFIINRPTYLKQLRSWLGTRLIKIIMGPRRCGKSYLMRMFQEELKKSGIKEDQILFYELDKFSQLRFHDPMELNDDIMKRLSSGKKTFLFIDEIQECKQFEKLLASLEHEENLEIYVTGSNAYMLSGELMTYLTGRYLSLEMYPLSFAEFRSAVEKDGRSVDEDFYRYLQIGSYPALIEHREDESFIDPYYELLVESMLFKDVAQRFRVKDPSILRQIVAYLASTIGSSVSALRIANTLKSAAGKKEVSDVTVGRYLNALSECYMFVPGRRYDVRGSAVLNGLEKYYLIDPGMRDHVVGTSTRDWGHLLENVVFLELKRRHRQVYVGRIGDGEIDFVCRDGVQACYVQVSASVLDEKTLEREIAPFRKLTDRYPCYLLTFDRLGADRNIEGVQLRNIVDWLLNSDAPF